MAFYRRNFPHLIIPGYAFFITTRLVNSLSLKKLAALRKEFLREMKRVQGVKDPKGRFNLKKEIHRAFFLKYDALLHENTTGPQWLADERIAQVVHDSLHWGDERRYHLIAFTILPNHIHVVLLPIWKSEEERKSGEPDEKDVYFLAKIMESLKKYTGREANKILGRKGQFWQHESYDHLIRNKREMKRAVNYTLMNPVKAGLVIRPEFYRWNYVNWDHVRY